MLKQLLTVSLMFFFSVILAFQTSSIPVDGYPWRLDVIEKDGVSYLAVIDRIDSQFILVNTSTFEQNAIPLPLYPSDLLVKDGVVYVTTVEEGKIVEVDPFAATVTREVATGKHVFRFLDGAGTGGFRVLSMDGTLLDFDADLNITGVYNLPRFSLDVAFWGDYLISLNSENYETIWGKFFEGGETGVYIQNLSTGETYEFYGGKIPSWIHVNDDRLYSLSYWDGYLVAFTEDLQIAGEIETGAKVNSPLWMEDYCYLLDFDDSELVKIDLRNFEVENRVKLSGRGPVVLEKIGRYFFVLNVLDDSVDVVSADSMTVEAHVAVGKYPIDIVKIDEHRAAVACEESGEIFLLWYNNPTNPR
ncbi:MAG: hypothetical protein PWP37_1251 [Thermotogota bacterium]|nr:hypothetical protein [Thermotogota bacterium]MDK2865059.1 hypothetical protein [Thermotogota bacterium]HCZ06603.1 hypothetical protein [Thermotogota bacterium]